MIALIDGDHMASRAFYALENYRGAYGQPAGAIYGFIQALGRVCHQLVPYFVVVCWGDRRANLWRRQLYPEYKANRKETPEEFISQVRMIQELLEGMGLCQTLCPTFEADDAIAAITTDCVAATREVSIVTGDHDLFQLIRNKRPAVCCHVPVKGEGYRKVTEEDVIEKFGVSPKLLPMFMALKGEKGEAEGVPGIGRKRAAEYILGQASDAVNAKVKAYQDRIALNLKLVNLLEIKTEELTPSTLSVMPAEYDEMRVLAVLRQAGLTGRRSLLSEVRSTLGYYQETQRRGAHSMDDILDEVR